MTNKEIMKTLQTRGRFKSPEEVDKFFLECLEDKDRQIEEAINNKL